MLEQAPKLPKGTFGGSSLGPPSARIISLVVCQLATGR